MTLLESITHDRNVAFDEARKIIWNARYSDVELSPSEMAHEVWMARVSQWNAAAIYRFKLKLLARPIAGVELVA
jgi:hypothetical protein